VAGLAIFPVFWIGHHELLGVPEWIWAEDGPMEYLTVALLAASAGFALIARRRGADRFDGAERALLLIFAVGLLVLAAEEISWGQ
ncbi:hypothetical protein, partial [Leifsonia sp. SIMBA_070]|uniref:hypothetical protein n=1 Tax=Leifsonia sp. SIMBA_070 TaxID=3085810 RepID=UPI00397C80AB